LFGFERFHELLRVYKSLYSLYLLPPEIKYRQKEKK